MERKLQALIESPEFGRYHKELHARGFNPFDVLQVADMEIRHSNVLAWLLRPDGTHGVGGRFLRALVEHLARRHQVPALQSLSGFDDKDNVEVRREDYHEGWYADITVGFKTEKVLLIIENKVVGGTSRPNSRQGPIGRHYVRSTRAGTTTFPAFCLPLRTHRKDVMQSATRATSFP